MSNKLNSEATEHSEKQSPVIKDEGIMDGRQDNAERLSQEEQMARFEEQLKEDDWGHQPC